jgi:hypothetical protein
MIWAKEKLPCAASNLAYNSHLNTPKSPYEFL